MNALSRIRIPYQLPMLLVAMAFVFSRVTPGVCGVLSDDFEDGQIGAWWYQYDGSIIDVDEYGGALHLTGPDAEAELWGDVLLYRHAESLTGDVSVTATFEAVNPAFYSIYGLVIANMDNSDHVSLSIFDETIDPGIAIGLADENVFSPPDYPGIGGIGLPDFSPGDLITLQLLKTGDQVTGYYSVNGAPFTQVGIFSVTTGDPFSVGVFGENWPPEMLGAVAYDFPLLDFEVSGPNVPDVVAGGGPDTFTDDFNDSSTYLLPVNPNTKWRQIGIPEYGSVVEDADAQGPGDHAARLISTDLGEFNLVALAADDAQALDISSMVVETQALANNLAGANIALGVGDDSGDSVIAGLSLGYAYDTSCGCWVFGIWEGNEYDGMINLDYEVLPGFDPAVFHTLRLEAEANRVYGILDRTWRVEGTRNLPIDIVVAGVIASQQMDTSYDNFAMSAGPDSRPLLFGNVEILEDTADDEMFPSWSRDGKAIAYIRDDMDSGYWNVWVSQVDPPAPPAKRTNDSDNVWIYAVPDFSPDMSHVLFTSYVAASLYDPIQNLQIMRVPANGSGSPQVVVSDPTAAWIESDISPSCSLLVGAKQPFTDFARNVATVELSGDGQAVPGTETMLTNFPPGYADTYNPHLDPTCDRLVFMAYVNPPTDTDLYVLNGVQDILSGATSAPTSFSDTRLVPVATGPNAQATGRFSRNGAWVYYTEDVNGVFDYDLVGNNPWLPWEELMNGAHWEIFAVNPDNPDERFKISSYRPYNQGPLETSPDGTMLVFSSDNRDDGDGVIDADLYIVSLITRKEVAASIGGSLTDGSGSSLDIPADALSGDTVVSMTTPFPGDIPPPDTLPVWLQNIAVTRAIETEPDNATIDSNNPATLAIHYNDEEIEGLDERSLDIWFYDEDTFRWDPIPASNRTLDLDLNFVTVKTSHFSMFAVVGVSEADALSLTGYPWEYTYALDGPDDVSICDTVLARDGCVNLGAAEVVVFADGILYTNFLIGTDAVDTLIGTPANDLIWGFAGEDYLRGYNGHDLIIGGPGNDRIYGDNNDDIMLGEDGNDMMYSGMGDDAAYGGDGADFIVLHGASDVNDYVDGGAGSIDKLLLPNGYGSFTMTDRHGLEEFEGGDGDDTIDWSSATVPVKIRGNDGSDILIGGSADDILVSGAGNDVCYGGDGKDLIILQDADDTLDTFDGGGGDEDRLLLAPGYGSFVMTNTHNFEKFDGADGGDIIDWSSATVRVVMRGNGGDDVLKGGSGNDLITGGDGDDALFGGDGSDILYGEGGIDHLTGGCGSDGIRGDGPDYAHYGANPAPPCYIVDDRGSYIVVRDLCGCEGIDIVRGCTSLEGPYSP